MSEISNYEAQKKKLQGLCDEHNFTFRFFKDRYPITLVITPINDVATQMDMLGNVEETGYCSQDSSMCWYFENSELKTKVKGTFSIDKVLFVAQDIDLIAGLMCYIQLSFLGCAGYVVIGNTITEPSTAYDRRGLLPAGPQSRIWYTPFFSTDIWFLRRQWAQIELLMKPVCRQTEQAEPEHKKDDAAPPLCETKTGQLTFF